MILVIDTSVGISAEDRRVLQVLMGNEPSPKQDDPPAAAKKAAPASRTAKKAAAAPKTPVPAPEATEAQEDPSPESGEEMQALLSQAIEKASALIREGNDEQVLAALNVVGVPKVTGLETAEQIRQFLGAL